MAILITSWLRLGGILMLDANGNKIRLTRTLVVDALKAALNGQVSEFQYFEDQKPITKHCCQGYAGVCHLNAQQWTFADEDGNIIVPYFWCPRCHKLLVYGDFM